MEREDERVWKTAHVDDSADQAKDDGRSEKETWRLEEQLKEQLKEASQWGDHKRVKRLHEELARDPAWKCDSKITRGAVEEGNDAFVIWHLTHCRAPIPDWLVELVVKCGRCEVLKTLTMEREIGSEYIINTAASRGSIEMIQWLHENVHYGWTPSTMDEAAAHGRHDMVHWLHVNRSEGCTTLAMNGAASNGHLDVVNWLQKNRSEGCTTSAMDGAASNGHLDMVKWLHENRSEGCTTSAMDGAASNGHLDMVKWLHENRSEGCTTSAMDGAASNGHLDMVKWLHENRYEGCTTAAIESLVAQRQFSVVEFLYRRYELKSWPRYRHARLFAKLACSLHQDDVAMVKHIARCRQERFQPDAIDNPFGGSIFDTSTAPDYTSTFVSMAIAIVVDAKELPSELREQLSGYIMPDPRDHVAADTALLRGWTHWLMSFSSHPNKDMVTLAEGGKLEGVRAMHGQLAQQGRLQCSKRLMYLTMVKGDLEMIRWHMNACNAHSFADWVYAATWVGRVDVIDWMCTSYSQFGSIGLDDDTGRYGAVQKTMLHSLDASFAQVEERFIVDLVYIEAGLSQEEETARDGDLQQIMLYCESARSNNRSPNLSNAADLAAIYGHLRVVEYLLQNELASCTVSGLYGAMVGGHVNVAASIYKLQPQLNEWPKRENHSSVLERFLSRDKEKVFQFLRHERKMTLDSRVLDEAAYRGDLERVRLICIFGLVESTASAADIAAVRGDLVMLETLFALGSPTSKCTTRALDGAAEEGHMQVVRYLHQRDAPCTRRAIDLSARNGHFEIVQYLLLNRQEGCSPFALFWACARGHAEVVRALTSLVMLTDLEKCFDVVAQEDYYHIAEILEKYYEDNNLGTATNQQSTRSIPRRRHQQEDPVYVIPSHGQVVLNEIRQQLGLLALPS